MKLEIKPIFVIQKSDSMAGKAKTEIACSLSWFRHWDAHQRQEFGKLLIEKDQATNQDTSDESIESLLGNLFPRNIFNVRVQYYSILVFTHFQELFKSLLLIRMYA